jgi:ABC-type branched-subunit amino acid transport system substrate-binding protein
MNNKSSMKFDKKAQQEIVGFVLIVVLVVIGLMVYLVFSLKSDENDNSVEVENILNALMKHTTDCAIVYEPDYDDFEELFKSAHKGKTCSNIDESALDYLNETLREVLDDIFMTEATVTGYEIQFYESGEDGEGDVGILQFSEGECTTGTISSAQKNLVSSSKDIVIRLKICTV